MEDQLNNLSMGIGPRKLWYIKKHLKLKNQNNLIRDNIV